MPGSIFFKACNVSYIEGHFLKTSFLKPYFKSTKPTRNITLTPIQNIKEISIIVKRLSYVMPTTKADSISRYLPTCSFNSP